MNETFAPELDSRVDPISRFRDWLAEAEKSEAGDATAAALATADAAGQVTARMVLLKGVDARGFVFYTNLESLKAEQLRANPRAALLFHWPSLNRQVRIEGDAAPIADAEADAYFATRPRGAQIGAWASTQSRPLSGRLALETSVARFTAKFGLGKVPRPAFWSGFRVVPRRIEFWRQRPFRLHDRLVYHREGSQWRTERLFP